MSKIENPTIAIPNEGCARYLTAGKEYEITKNYTHFHSDRIFFEINNGSSKLLCIKHRDGRITKNIDGHAPKGWTLK